MPVAILILIGIITVAVLVGIIAIIVVIMTADPTSPIVDNSCAKTTSGLDDISSLLCIENQTTKACTNNKYITDTSFNYNVVTVPYEVNYINACATICTGPISNGKCSVAADDAAYQTCIERLEPIACDGESMPVAFSDNIFYYAQQFVVPGSDLDKQYSDTCQCLAT